MKIKAIEKQKNGKYKLCLDDRSKISTYDEVILNNNLLFNQNIDIDMMDKINKENIYYNLYNKIVKMISTRIRSEKEISDYLDKCEVSFDDKTKIIGSLKQNGLINDNNFARAFIHDKILFTNYGPLKIKSELIKQNIPVDVIDKYLDELGSKVFDDKIYKYVAKKIKNNHKCSSSILKTKIKSELYNLGYQDIEIDSLFDEDSDDIIEKELRKEYLKLSKKYSGDNLKKKVYQRLYQKGFKGENILRCLDNMDI